MKADLEARLESEYRNGDWFQDPWFLRQENEWLREAGFPLATRARLVPLLKALYPGHVCRRMLFRPLDGGLVLGLFHAWPPLLIPALDVVADLETVPEALGSSLVGQLRDADRFAGAAAELGVWAALARGGFDVHREPAVPTDDSVRYPDFGVVVGSDYYLVEVSQLQESAWSKAAKLVEERLVLESHPFFEDRIVRIAPNPEFLNGPARKLTAFLEVDNHRTREELRRFVGATLLPSVRSTVEHIRARSAAPGTYPVDGVGWIHVTTGRGKEAVSDLMPRPPPEDVAKRVLRKTIEEARQLQPGRRRLRRGVVVIDIGRAASIVPVARALASLIAKNAPDTRERLDSMDALLLRGWWEKPNGHFASAVHPMVNARVIGKRASAGLTDLIFAIGGGWIIRAHGDDVRIRSRRTTNTNCGVLSRVVSRGSRSAEPGVNFESPFR